MTEPQHTEAEYLCYGCREPSDDLTLVRGRGSRDGRLHCPDCKNQVRSAAGLDAGWNA